MDERIFTYDFRQTYNKILDYGSYVKRYVVIAIPSVSRDLRIHFLDEVYMLTKNIFYDTYNKGSIRMKYLIEKSKTKIKVLDIISMI